MNYRETFKRYQAGTASDDEQQWVEQEIERFHALEDYLSEEMDGAILSDIPQEEIARQETKQLRRTINRRLGRVVLTALLAMIGLYLFVFYVVSGVIDHTHYDPSRTELNQSEAKAFQLPDVYYQLSAYTSLNHPHLGLESAYVESEHFGNHRINYRLRNLFSGEAQSHEIHLSRDRIENTGGVYDGRRRTGEIQGFDLIQFPADRLDYGNRNRTSRYYLEHLSPLNYVSLSLVFDQDKSLEELYQMIDQNQAVKFIWAGVRIEHPEAVAEGRPVPLLGFRPEGEYTTYAGELDDDKYPLFFLNDIFREDDYIDDYAATMAEGAAAHFKSRLQLLIDQAKFVEVMDPTTRSSQSYQASLDYIEAQGLATYGVVVVGNVERLNDLIEAIPYRSLYINQVLPAEPSIQLYANPVPVYRRSEPSGN